MLKCTKQFVRSSAEVGMQLFVSRRPTPVRPVIVVVEGIHDIEFLKRLSARLHRDAPSVPDLRQLEQDQAIIFIPCGGGQVLRWAERLSPLGCPEFYLFDRETQPETALRLQAAERINSRPGCRALVTSKRSLENYLHPQAMVSAGGGMLEVADEQDLPLTFARRDFLARSHDCDWQSLSIKARRKMAATAKKWLNTVAVDAMSLELLRDRNPEGELLGWIMSIGNVAAPRL